MTISWTSKGVPVNKRLKSATGCWNNSRHAAYNSENSVNLCCVPMLQFCSRFICEFIFQRCRFVGRGGVSGRSQLRDTNSLRLQSSVYVRCAHGCPRLRGEWIRFEGNKFILFYSQLTAVRGRFTCKYWNESLCTILLDWKTAKKQICISWGGLRLSPLDTVWPIVPVQDGSWCWLWSNWWNANL